MLIRLFLICILASVLSTPVLAKTLYVNANTGNDTVTYDQNSSDRPWRTIGRAAWGSTDRENPNSQQAARAGDVVLIAPGVYWETGDRNGGRFTVSLNPVNDGEAGNPITFRGEGLVYIRLQAGYRGGMIGCNGRNYIVWDNFQIDDYYGGSTSDTGPVIFSGHARFCQIINSDVKGHPGSYYHGYPTFGGNYRGISLEPAHNILIRNNRIHNFRGGQNEAGIMAYDSNDNRIENNELFGNGQGIFIKGIHPGSTQARNIIRFNIVRNNSSGGIRVLSAQDTLVYQNVVINNDEMGLWAGFFESTRSQFVNNTVVGNGRAIVPQGNGLVDVLFHGNIIVGNEHAIHNWDQTTPSTQDIRFSRNLYFANETHAVYLSGSYSLTNWQLQFGLDEGSIEADPLFVDQANGDFRLRAGSAARALGRDILGLTPGGTAATPIPAGAYITGEENIGPSGLDPLAAEPLAPTDVGVE